MHHRMYHSGMDAIDYELSDDGGDYDYDGGDFEDSDFAASGESGDSGGGLDEWRYGSDGLDDYSGDSDEESQKFATNNLRNPKTFPSYVQCAPYELYDSRDWNNEPIPPPRHWCYLGEIVKHTTVPIRNVLTVRDKDGEDTHLTTNFDLEAEFDVKVGSTIAVLYAEKKYFSFGAYGLRLDHAKFVKIFPCNLETLLRINDDIESETPGNSPKKCKGCGKEEESDKAPLRRCSRCLGVSYCGTECQTDAWKRGHKRECKIFAAVIELKGSRDWANNNPRDWVAFGQREELRSATSDDEGEDESDDEDRRYRFQPEWKDTQAAVARELQGTFTVTSGTCELLWGQLASILSGLTHSEHDFPSTEDRAVPGGTVFVQGYTYRAPARVGIWKVVKVNGYGKPDAPKDSWLAYHSSCYPLELLLLARPVDFATRSTNPRVCWVNRYDWGYHCADPTGAAQFFADIDPGSGWAAAIKRQDRLESRGKYRGKKDRDNERWERLETYDSRNTFLVDAANGPEVLKLVAQPSELDTHLKDDKSTSFFKSEEAADAFGCNLNFIGGGGWECARLIFGEESAMFPGKKKELVGFWYDDNDNRYNDSEIDMGWKLEPPMTRRVPVST
ncbi:hypothetical protein DFH06DRAFT_250852 [Mycena polygramma]|nr:hypothetical protein DFH06DRAFT_250852 [Mycena polygramma]